MWDVDPNAIDIDYSVVKKFSMLGVSPPSSTEDVERVTKELRDLRDSLNVAGKMSQAEGKARFLKDESFIETEEYKGQKEKMDAASKTMLAQIARIRKDAELRL